MDIKIMWLRNEPEQRSKNVSAIFWVPWPRADGNQVCLQACCRLIGMGTGDMRYMRKGPSQTLDWGPMSPLAWAQGYVYPGLGIWQPVPKPGESLVATPRSVMALSSHASVPVPACRQSRRDCLARLPKLAKPRDCLAVLLNRR